MRKIQKEKSLRAIKTAQRAMLTAVPPQFTAYSGLWDTDMSATL